MYSRVIGTNVQSTSEYSNTYYMYYYYDRKYNLGDIDCNFFVISIYTIKYNLSIFEILKTF